MDWLVALALSLGPYVAIIALWVIYYKLAKNRDLAALGQGPNVVGFLLATILILLLKGDFSYTRRP
jgi:hypothetical protein